MNSRAELRQRAIEVFHETVQKMDAEKSVLDAVRLTQNKLAVADTCFDLDEGPRIYSVAIGKAANGMARALTKVLGSCLTGGILSGPGSGRQHDAGWRTFAGGHPQPNQQSLDAGAAALEMLNKAGRERALVIFLVSGGGSAMMEWPRQKTLTLEDLIETNRTLVGSGAAIKEINRIRAMLSGIKNGGLSRAAQGANQVSLIISDTNSGEAEFVASGPTIFSEELDDFVQAGMIIDKYGLRDRLPVRVVCYLSEDAAPQNSVPRHPYFVLLDNQRAVDAAAASARSKGMQVQIADDIVEDEVGQGIHILISRLRELRRAASTEHPVCLISGGEFACKVKGKGLGGRNSEASLRAALELNERDREMVILNAGTDGIDGNSPAAGAIADDTTISRARELGLDVHRYLDNSDAFSLFSALGDAIETGPTGTNVRDIRIFLAN
jgi:glycerate 2-kinase